MSRWLGERDAPRPVAHQQSLPMQEVEACLLEASSGRICSGFLSSLASWLWSPLFLRSGHSPYMMWQFSVAFSFPACLGAGGMGLPAR